MRLVRAEVKAWNLNMSSMRFVRRRPNKPIVDPGESFSIKRVDPESRLNISGLVFLFFALRLKVYRHIRAIRLFHRQQIVHHFQHSIWTDTARGPHQVLPLDDD